MFPFDLLRKGRLIDERFILHRYRSTSHAGVIVAVIMGAWSLYDLMAHDRMRWDFLALIGVMAATKLGFMAWYRLRD